MEFWGIEVKGGQPVTVELEEGKILHISQAAMGEVTGDAKKDKGSESTCLFLKLLDDDNSNSDNSAKRIVLGTLSSDKFPQMPMDLVLDKDFELSHNWKNFSVYFAGYYVSSPAESDSEEDMKLVDSRPEALKKADAPMSEPAGGKQVKIVEPQKDEDSSSDDEEEDDTSEEEDGSSGGQKKDTMIAADNEEDEDSDNDDEDDEDDEDTSSSDEDLETPNKAEPSNKRPAASALKTPVPGKKAKLITPQRTDGKNTGGGHVATPHPAKQAGKASTSAGQAKQTPKAGGSFPCKSCGRTFGSENALSSHTKAKHGAAA